MRVYIDSRAGDAKIQRELTATHMLLLQKLTALDIGYTQNLAEPTSSSCSSGRSG